MSKLIYEQLPKLTIQQVKHHLNGKSSISFNCEDRRFSIQMAYSPCHFGGLRPWFVCPLCGRRVSSLLYVQHRFGCRHCFNTCYASENKSRSLRQRQKEVKALSKLGFTSYQELLWFGDLRKPKGMHYSTFEREANKISSIFQRSADLISKETERLLAKEQKFLQLKN